MKYLTADFGSTFTKLTAIDSDSRQVLATASAFTTIETDIIDGFNAAMQKLEAKIGRFEYEKLLCCSSAGGGLKMVALGLVPELTAKAAKMAASSAGAKVIKTYSFEISQQEQDEIYDINPDLVLLCGGTDGGNKEVIVANAKRLCDIKRDFSIIVAGNKSASYDIEEIFKGSGKDYVITKNVMPTFNKLDIEPAKKSIKDLFIKKIIEAKGLSGVQQMATGEVIPTPLAVMNACELLSKGTKSTEGIGELVAIDLGGATTDIYSMASGKPSQDNVLEKGLPEPFSKRTVEGDLGMRYSLHALVDELDMDDLERNSGIAKEKIENWVKRCSANPDTIAETDEDELKIEELLARSAVEMAVERHCGYMESTYSPMGEIFTLVGKDLSEVPSVVGIGGAIINSRYPASILEGAKYSIKKFNYMKPKSPRYLIDQKYIFASMGLISTVDPELALDILKKEIKQI
ncbi:methylaspartate mutase accessory protein GlmL [Dysgonomonas massiliensis]|uniref:methylaspartate mutase accessory protein GlmL n=1 Tax=Dysgonomonas massiliensis TaxID=2040292 RepID=UPI000C78DA50|nr:methylaspartate mutase accessory protein GlmL [Dysgonomonas massiliensis]